jgi:serine/threonine-protein kinase
MEPIRCYTEAELRAFVLGKLADDQCQAIAEHLEQCPTCEAAADRLDGEADQVICDLRQAVSPAAATPPERANTPSTPATTVLTSSPGAAADDPDDLPALPGYELLEELGRGGMGIVYKAWQQGLRRLVAVKTLPEGAPAELRARFRVEAEAAARLTHPNIVAVHEVGGDSRRPLLVMEFVEGGSLAGRLVGAPLPAEEAARLVELLAGAVEYAHQRGVLHRDLKPANVLLTSDGTPKVADFGLARLLADGADLTRTGVVLGTPSYMAPEQARAGTQPVGPAADVYALGAILYECLTGRPPFKGVTDLETLNLVVEAEPVSPRQLQPGLPRDLDTICLKCLQKEPGGRYPSAAELADDLGRHLHGEPIRARPVGPLERGLKWARRRPTAAALAAAVVALTVGLAAGGTWVWQQAASRREAVEVALKEADDHRDAGRWAGVRAALERARGHLAGGGPADLRARVEQAGRDAEVVAELERVRLRQTELKDWAFDIHSADEGYTRVLREYGVEVDTDEPEKAAARVRSSAVREQLLAALDQWWTIRLGKDDREGADRVRAVADQADEDGWRAQMREAVANRDLAQLRGLVRQVGGRPPTVQVVLARVLRAWDAAPEAEGVLRQGLAEHPGDFWLATELGGVLSHGGRLRDAEEYYRVALGLRPDSPGAWINLGSTLENQGKLEEAVACCRRAIRLNSQEAPGHYTLGVALMRQKKVEEAVDCFRQAIQLDPSRASAHNNLGSALVEQGKLEEAKTSYRRAIELDPKHAKVHYNLGLVLRKQGRLEEAAASFRRGTLVDPNDAMIHYDLGHVLEDLGKVDEALASYRRTIEQDPKHALAHNNLGHILREQGNVEEAMACYRRAIQSDPKYAPPHYNLGLILAEQGPSALDDAVACFRCAIRLDPDLALAHQNLGFTLFRQNRLDEALGSYRRALQLEPGSSVAHVMLGTILYRQGKVEEAVACYRRALSLDPKNAHAHYNLGLALRKLRKLEEAMACYRRAIELDPKMASAHHNLGGVLYAQGKVEEAMACYRRAIELDPTYAQSHNSLGLVLVKQGKLEEAVACYRQAIRLDPKFALPHNNLGLVLVKRGKLDEAVASFRRAVELDRDYAAAHDNLGLTLVNQGKPDQAETWLRRAVLLAPNDYHAHFNLGLSLYRQGKVDEAVACFRRATELGPNFASAHVNLGGALYQQGKLDQAVACFRRGVRLEPNDAAAHCNLGHALRGLGQFREALAALERGHQLGSRSAGWRYPSADWVRDCRRLVELEDRLPAVLAGTDRPAEAERLGFIRLCQSTRRFAAAARLSVEAFAAQPGLADTLRAEHRYNAACCAARAGCGEGADAAGLTPADRLRWRRQALTWLAADLAAWERALVSGGAKAGALVVQKMRHWQADTDLAGVRDPALLARLPAEERAACERLWADVAELLRRAQATK